MTLSTPSPVTILVADDEQSIRSVLKIALEQDKYEVLTADDGEQALEIFGQRRPDLVILDVAMPKVDGWEVLREIRAHSDVPVCMLTARVHDTEQLTGFGLGADDYVTKPFSVQQVLARVRTILRRSGHTGRDQLVAGPLVLDMTSREVRIGLQQVSLIVREFALLEVLVRNPDRVFTRTELLSRCWESGYAGVDRVVDVHMASLRRKLGKHRRLLKTVRGIGYKFSRPS
jgi:DNA-binding response OmpR family regulator